MNLWRWFGCMVFTAGLMVLVGANLSVTAQDKKTQEITDLIMSINIGGTSIAYDSTKKDQPQNPMTDFFKALLGLKLKFTINSKMEVQSIEGQEDFVRKLAATNPQMDPLLKSILS